LQYESRYCVLSIPDAIPAEYLAYANPSAVTKTILKYQSLRKDKNVKDTHRERFICEIRVCRVFHGWLIAV